MSSFNLLESTSDYFIEDPAVNRTVSPTEGREPASRKRRKETNPKWELEFTKRSVVVILFGVTNITMLLLNFFFKLKILQ